MFRHPERAQRNLAHLEPRLSPETRGVLNSLLAQSPDPDLALHYLEEGLSAVEMSKQLGFSETNAFHRAFKRWMGQSVGEYRRSTPPVERRQVQGAVH